MKIHILRFIIVCALLEASFVCGNHGNVEVESVLGPSIPHRPSSLNGGGILGIANVDTLRSSSNPEMQLPRPVAAAHLRGARSTMGRVAEDDRQLRVDNIFRSVVECDLFCNKPRRACGNRCRARITSCEAQGIECHPWLCRAFCRGDRSTRYCENRQISSDECNRYRKGCSCRNYIGGATETYDPVSGLTAFFDYSTNEVVIRWDKVQGPKLYDVRISKDNTKVKKLIARGSTKKVEAALFDRDATYDVAVRRKKAKTIGSSPYVSILYKHSIDENLMHRAKDDTAPTNEDYVGDLTGNVLDNDSDPDFGHTLTVDLHQVIEPPGSTVTYSGDGLSMMIELPNGSTLSLSVNGKYIFRRASGAYQELSGTQEEYEQFKYVVDDNHGNTAEATLYVRIQGANDAPIALNDLFIHSSSDPTTIEDIADGCVLENDKDIDIGDVANLAVCVVDGVEIQNDTHQHIDLGQHTKLSIGADGCFTMSGLAAKYQHLAKGETSDACFFYQSCDGFGYKSNIAEACVRVRGTFVNLCIPNPCGHGSCTVPSNITGSYLCSCDSGWGGNNCDEDVDECLTNNGGCDILAICTNTAGSYACGPCPPGDAGTGDTECTEIIIDPCDLSPCVHGTCSTLSTIVDGYSCSCDAGWEGTKCDESTGGIHLGLNCSLVHRTLPINTQPFRTLDLSQWEGDSVAIVTIFSALSEPRIVMDIPLSSYSVEDLDSVLALHQSFTLEASKPGDTFLTIPNFLKGMAMCKPRFNSTFFIPTNTRKICVGNETCRLTCLSTFPSAEGELLAKGYVHESRASHRYICMRPGDSICQEDGEWDFSIGQQSSGFVSYYKRVGVFYADTTSFCFDDSNGVSDEGQPRFLLRNDISNETLGSLFCSRKPTGPVKLKILSANESEYTGLPVVHIQEKESSETLLKVGWATVADSPIACISLRSDCRYDGKKEDRPFFCDDVETYDSILAYFVAPTSADEIGADEMGFIDQFWNETKAEYKGQFDLSSIENFEDVFVKWYYSNISSAIDLDKIFGDLSVEDSSLNTTMVDQSNRLLESSFSDHCALLFLDIIFDAGVILLGSLGINKKAAEPIAKTMFAGKHKLSRECYKIIRNGFVANYSPFALGVDLFTTIFGSISAHTIMLALEQNIEKIGLALLELAFQRFLLTYASGGLYLAVQILSLVKSISGLIQQVLTNSGQCFGSGGNPHTQEMPYERVWKWFQHPDYSPDVQFTSNLYLRGIYTALRSSTANYDMQYKIEGPPGAQYGCPTGIAFRSQNTIVEWSVPSPYTPKKMDSAASCPLRIFVNGTSIAKNRESSLSTSTSKFDFLDNTVSLPGGVAVTVSPSRSEFCSCFLGMFHYFIPATLVESDMIGREYPRPYGRDFLMGYFSEFEAQMTSEALYKKKEKEYFEDETKQCAQERSLFPVKVECPLSNPGRPPHWLENPSWQHDHPPSSRRHFQITPGIHGNLLPALNTTQAFLTLHLFKSSYELHEHPSDQLFGSTPDAFIVHHREGYLRNFPIKLPRVDGSLGGGPLSIYSSFESIEATFPMETFNFVAYPVYGGFVDTKWSMHKEHQVIPTPLDAAQTFCEKDATKLHPQYLNLDRNGYGACYGVGVAISDNVAVVSLHERGYSKQIFFIFMRSVTGKWFQRQVLTIPFTNSYVNGPPVAVDGNTIIIGQSMYTLKNDVWAFEEDLSSIIALPLNDRDKKNGKYFHGVSLKGNTAVFAFNQSTIVLSRNEKKWQKSSEILEAVPQTPSGSRHFVSDGHRIVMIGRKPLELIVFTIDEYDFTWSRQIIAGLLGHSALSGELHPSGAFGYTSLKSLCYEGLALCGDTVYAATMTNSRIDRYGLSQSGTWQLEATLSFDTEGCTPAQVGSIACIGDTVFVGFPRSNNCLGFPFRAGKVRSSTREGKSITLSPFLDDYDTDKIEAINQTTDESSHWSKRFYGTNVAAAGNNLIISEQPGYGTSCHDDLSYAAMLGWSGPPNEGSVYIYEFAEDCPS